MRLKELQSEFQKALLEKDPSFLFPRIKEPAQPKADRMSVYRYALGERVREALESTYDITCEMIQNHWNEAAWKQLCNEYFHRHPLGGFGLDDICVHFKEFILRHSVSETFPFLPELVDFEWKMAKIAYSTPLETSGSQWSDVLSCEQAQSKLTLYLANSALIAEYHWPVHRFLSEPSLRKVPLELRPSCQQVVFYLSWEDLLEHRRNYELLSESQYKLLALLEKGIPFPEFAERVEQNLPEVTAESLQTWFQNWVAMGVIDTRA